MDTDGFKILYDNLENNINEIKSTVKQKNLLEKPNHVKILERTKYLFYSLAKSLIDIGHSIIFENNLRKPVNRTDIFIILAEEEIVMSSLVPGVKKAVLALPRINNYQYSEILKIISESINDLHKCLDCFGVYYKLEDKQK